jgi:hypothetical protein
MKKQVEDWILLANNDLRTSEIIIKDEYPSHEQAKEFIDCAKEIKTIIINEIKQKKAGKL